jgi:hypothetical protein
MRLENTSSCVYPDYKTQDIVILIKTQARMSTLYLCQANLSFFINIHPAAEGG